MAPDQINLVYRKVGEHHIFASKGIKGLVHVGHSNLEDAYTRLLQALNLHVLHTYQVEARYECELGYEGLQKKLLEGAECAFVHVTNAQLAA